MPNGILIIDKPAGWTSHDVVAKLRGILHEKRIGPAGTQDPMATGVLPILLGRAAKALNFLPDTDKEYTAAFRLGERRDTGDITGADTKERIRAARRAANPEGITENTSKKKQQLRERQGREAAAKDFEAKKRAAAGLAPEEAAEVLSGDPERPFSRGRAYSSEHYTKHEENE